MDDASDQAIARGLRDGKADAWGALYDAYAEPVWRSVARLMPPNSADVADVVQETFLAAARSARTFDPARGTLWVWLWGIARRGVALHYRKQEQRERVRQARAAAAAADGACLAWLDGQAPPDLAAAAELAVLVRVTLAELPSEYEMLLTAKYLDGNTIEEMARQSGCSLAAVHSKLARARRAFREAFGRHAAAPAEPSVRTQDEPSR
jgi:RNA polymerase sigma-70 factor (ECF subfamily)